MAKTEIPPEAPDLSLVLGGPLFRLYRRAYLSGDALELARRRVLVIATVAWLPLLILSWIGGHAFRDGVSIPFLYDIEAHARFLIALPVLVLAELTVHSRVLPAVRRFVERRIIIPEDIPKFGEAVSSAKRLRDSVSIEVVILILVYTVGLWVWRSQIATGIESWYATSEGVGWHLTPAGYWYAFISVPIFQFILLRWYFRFVVWFQFLWRVSRLNLSLIATHPDRAAGLGFLGTASYAFAPLLFAQGALLAGWIANRVLYEGQDLTTFKLEAAGLVAFFMFFVLSPLLVFTPKLARAKREGLRDYGEFGSRYVRGFEQKWIKQGASSNEELLGSADIQSLADLGNSFTVVQETRQVPFGLKDALSLAAATAAPLLPLMLTVFSFEELFNGVLKILI